MTPNPAPAPAPRKSGLQELLAILWQQPLLAIPFAIFFGLLNGGRQNTFVLAYFISLLFSYCIRILLWAMEHLWIRKLREGCDADDVPGWRIGILYSCGGVVGSLIAAVIVNAFIVPGFLGDIRSALLWLMFTLLFTLLFGGLGSARSYYRRAVDRAKAVEAMRAELALAELRVLRAQIQPHFLFNTLNSIAALIPENPVAAESMLTQLAEVLRYTLTASGREHVPLREEMEFVRAYLDIEKTRLGGRLVVKERIEPGLEGVPVPALLVQPLVENAVRHGIGGKPEGGAVEIDVRREGGLMVIEVRDDGVGMRGSEPPRGHGIGLSSARERLAAAGPPHAIDIESEIGRGTRVVLHLPLPGDSKGATS